MSEPIVVVEALKKTFVHMGRPLDVLKGIDLTILQGEVVAIVGTSGAGKSTLLHIIGTLDVPSKGRIKLGKDDVTGLSSAKLAAIRNKAIGFVFQFHHLLPEFSALENVMMPGLIQGRDHKQMEAVAMGLLEEVRLGNRATHRPGELSGGEQQRVALARALVLSPKLILADEPTGNLDSKTGGEIQDLFFQMNQRHGTTIVIVTHDLAFAHTMPRVVTMKDGLIDSDERHPERRSLPEGAPSSKGAVSASQKPSADANGGDAADAPKAPVSKSAADGEVAEAKASP